MDNNNQTQPAPAPTPQATAQPAAPAGQPSQPSAVTPNMAQPTTPPAGGNKKLLWLFIGLLVVVLIGGLVYWFMNRNTPAPVTNTQTTQPATSKAEPTLDEEINAIEVEDVEKELDTIDQDLQGL